jgi:hypothetical protein
MTEVPDDKDEFLERYLLNELSEVENEEFEDEMVLDKKLIERVQAVEMCLIDSYVTDEMSPAERLRFERGFLLFPENRLKVEDARALHEGLRLIRKEQSAGQGSQTESLPPEQPAGGAAHAPRLRRSWFPRLPTPVLALAALLLLAIGLGMFLIPWRDVFKIQTHNLSVKATPTPQTTHGDSQNQTATNQNAPPPEQQTTPTPEMAALPPKTVYETIKEQPGFIVAGTSRGSGTGAAKARPVAVRKGSEFLMLTMTLLPERQVANGRPLSVAVYDAHNLDSALFPSGGGLRLTPRRVSGSKQAYAVTLRIPTSLLRDGRTYYVRIDEEPKATPITIKMTDAER